MMSSCSIYGLSNANIGEAKTIQVDFFPNQAEIIEPSLTQRFTNDLENFFITNTSLTSNSSNGDLHFNGEITGFKVTPTSGLASQTAAKNRLTVTVNVRFVNKLVEKNNFEKNNFEKTFSFYSDFDANSQLIGSILEGALDEIVERITQDIFNLSIANDF
jgi:hypothetical protein